MRRACLLALTPLATLAISGCSAAAHGSLTEPEAVRGAAAGRLTTAHGDSTDGAVTSSSGAFSIVPAKGWDRVPGQDAVTDDLGLVRTTAPTDRPLLTVRAIPGDRAAAASVLASLRQASPAGSVVAAQDVWVAGERAHGITHTFAVETKAWVSTSFALHHDGTVYVLQLSSTREEVQQTLAELGEMLTTWKWR